MQIPEFKADLDLAHLPGATVDAYAQDDGYWHMSVALRIAEDMSFVFRTEERAAGARFEVFPISAHRDAMTVPAWRTLARPFEIQRVLPLWRSEWIERGAQGPAAGSDPSTHHAGRGPAPAHVSTCARVLAGVLLYARSGESMVVAASSDAPFNVDIFLTEAVERALEGFEPV